MSRSAVLAVTAALLLGGCGGSGGSDTVTTIHSAAELRRALAEMSPQERRTFLRKKRFAERVLRAEANTP